MSFTKNDLDKIKSKISIRSELEKKTKLIQKGKDYWCCCPFHKEKTPSCKINEDQDSFYCFGCGVKGDIFTIYTDLYNYNFIDAVKELSQQAGVSIDFENTKQSKQEDKINEILELTCLWFEKNLDGKAAEVCNNYLLKRKLTSDTIKKFRLGYSKNSESSLYELLKSKNYTDNDLLQSNVVKLDKNKKIRDFFYKRLIFPIFNSQSKVVGFGGRSLDGTNPKYINSPESKIFQKRNILYNLNIAKNISRKKKNLLICEGYMDVISLNQNGVESVVAPLGTALTEAQLLLAWKYCLKPTIMFDGDAAGLRASYKSAILALSLISSKNFLQFVTLPEESDPDSYIHKVSFEDFLQKLKTPSSLSEFIFNQSVKSVSLLNMDEKISYDKYLDDLTLNIKNKQIQYFYKQEFKSLFFNKIRELRNSKLIQKKIPKKSNFDLSRKQILSFFLTAINHESIREKILEELLNSELINKNELKFIKKLKKKHCLNLKDHEITSKFESGEFSCLYKEVMTSNTYQLFSYSLSSFDPQLSLTEVLKSIKNLNTRLLNLKKINKSLDTFLSNSNQLNWSDLQTINLEILNED